MVFTFTPELDVPSTQAGDGSVGASDGKHQRPAQLLGWFPMALGAVSPYALTLKCPEALYDRVASLVEAIAIAIETFPTLDGSRLYIVVLEPERAVVRQVWLRLLAELVDMPEMGESRMRGWLASE